MNEISRIENYFNQEIKERNLNSKTVYNCIWLLDKILIVWSAKSGGVSIISFVAVIGAPVRIVSASFALILNHLKFSLVIKHVDLLFKVQEKI